MRIRSFGGRSLFGPLVSAVSIVLFPLLLSNPYYLNVANIIGLNTIIVVGLTLLIGYAGQVSLGHAAFYGIGAYASAILTVTYGVSPWLALVSGSSSHRHDSPVHWNPNAQASRPLSGHGDARVQPDNKHNNSAMRFGYRWAFGFPRRPSSGNRELGF